MLFIVVYGIMFSVGIYFINRLIVRGLEDARRARTAHDARAARWLAAGDAAREATVTGMTAMEWYLPLIWAGIIGSAVALYVILDGFDLGIGVLFPFAKDDAERDQMMASIAPFWDGNETWLVMGGGGLLVAFPMAYSIIMPALYLPVIVMLLALVFRGVAFEFREIGHNKALWNAAFAGGSTLAAFLPGHHPRQHDPAASGLRTARLPAARSTGRRRLRCCAGWAWWRATHCWARPG